VVEWVPKHYLNHGFGERSVLPSFKTPLISQLPYMLHRRAAGRVRFQKAANQRPFNWVDHNLSDITVVQISGRCPPRPFTSSQFFPDRSFDVVRKVIGVKFGLPKGKIEHEFALRRVFKPERSKLQ